MTAERRSHVFKFLTLLIFLGGCSSTTKTANTTAATFPAVTTVTKLTTTAPAPATTLEPTTTTPPITIAPAVTKSPSTTIQKTTPTTYPQLQLTGTQQEMTSQIVAALVNVITAGHVGGFGPWSIKLYQLKQSIASYGITIDADPGTHIYKISMNGQSACFIRTIYDKLEPRAC